MGRASVWTVVSAGGCMIQFEKSIDSDEKDMRIVPIMDLHCRLGEGLHWDSVRNSLWGVSAVG